MYKRQIVVIVLEVHGILLHQQLEVVVNDVTMMKNLETELTVYMFIIIQLEGQ